MRCSASAAKRCIAEPGPPRTAAILGLQRTIRFAHAALRPGHETGCAVALTSPGPIHRFRALSPRAATTTRRPAREAGGHRPTARCALGRHRCLELERVCTNRVMPGLDPGIHLLAKRMDCRVEPGNDELRGVLRRWMDCRVEPGNDEAGA